MYEIERIVLVPVPRILGMDLSITNEVVLVWIAAGLTLLVLILACRRRGPVATGPFQNLFEWLIEFVDLEIVRGSLGPDGRAWLNALLALFFFVLFSDLLGLVPIPHFFKAATSNISVTGGLALFVFATALVLNLRRHGLLGFLKKFMPAGLPRAIAVVTIPIEVVSWLAKPLSLAIRLFANMMAGHTLIFVFIGMAMAAPFYLKWIPFAGAVLMSGFELFVCFIQALIFTMLAGIYIREALETH